MKKGRQDRIAETLTVFILSAGIYVFSAMAVYFPASSEFSPCIHLPAIGHAEGFFFSLKDFEVSILQPECR